MIDSEHLRLRPATPVDRPFLERVYAESRATELAATEWSDDEKAAFCGNQFAAQDQHYHTHYPHCEYLIVELRGAPIGRLYRELRQGELCIVDIALLVAARGQGVGERLMTDIQTEAAVAGLWVRIHVERTNPARHLYERLGFTLVEAGAVYDLLAWKPQ